MTHRTKRDPVDVLHADVLASPGGIKAAAALVGRSAGIMHNKFSEAMPHYEITVREAVALALAVRSTGFAEAVCEQFSGVFLAMPEGAAGDDDVLQAYVGIVEKMGDLSREFTEARADGIIEPAEFSAIRLRGNRTIVAILHYLAELETLVREVPPSPLVRVVG